MPSPGVPFQQDEDLESYRYHPQTPFNGSPYYPVQQYPPFTPPQHKYQQSSGFPPPQQHYQQSNSHNSSDIQRCTLLPTVKLISIALLRVARCRSFRPE
jgi:hypothetical protein